MTLGKKPNHPAVHLKTANQKNMFRRDKEFFCLTRHYNFAIFEEWVKMKGSVDRFVKLHKDKHGGQLYGISFMGEKRGIIRLQPEHGEPLQQRIIDTIKAQNRGIKVQIKVGTENV